MHIVYHMIKFDIEKNLKMDDDLSEIDEQQESTLNET